MYDGNLRVEINDVVELLNCATDKITKLEQPKQTKTVADAYEEFSPKQGKTFVTGHWSHIRANNQGDMFFAEGNTDGENWRDSYLVCTREQFEAYAKEQEAKPHFKATRENLEKIARDAEGDKWTHIDAFGDPCRILIEEKDNLGYVVILRQSGHYATPAASSLKPIKPKLTKAEAWDKLTSGSHVCLEVGHVRQQYEITD